jgi:hypothetical protein
MITSRESVDDGQGHMCGISTVLVHPASRAVSLNPSLIKSR